MENLQRQVEELGDFLVAAKEDSLAWKAESDIWKKNKGQLEEELSQMRSDLKRVNELADAAQSASKASVQALEMERAGFQQKLKESSVQLTATYEEVRKLQGLLNAAVENQTLALWLMKNTTAGASEGISTLQEPRPAVANPFPHGWLLSHDSDVHLTPSCGSWQREYTQLHRNMRAESKEGGKQRFIIFRCDKAGGGGTKCGGIGDVLVGIASTFMVALLTKRAMIIHWDYAQMLFEPVAIDWIMSEDVDMSNLKTVIVRDRKLEELNGLSDVNDGDNVYLDLYDVVNQWPAAVHSTFDAVKHAKNLVVRWNHGIAVWMTETHGDTWGEELRRMGLTQPIVFGCLIRFLIRPKTELAEAVQPQLQLVGDGSNSWSICLHVRPHDGMSWTDGEANVHAVNEIMNDDNVQSMFHCAEKLTEFWFPASVKTEWLLLSSSQAFKMAAKERYPQVVVTDVVPLHSDVGSEDSQLKGLKAAMAEWILLTHCHAFIFQESGFSKTAALYAMRPQMVFMFPRHGLTHFEQRCDPQVPTTAIQLSHSWSGA